MTIANVIFSPGFASSLRANEFDGPVEPWTVEQLTVTAEADTTAAAPAGTTIAIVTNGNSYIVVRRAATVTVGTGWLLSPGASLTLPCAAGDVVSIISAGI